MGWGKKTIYHSELRKESPVKLMFTIGVQTTKYADRQDYAPFRLPDDSMEYTYQIENDACADAIRAAPMNTWLLVTAEGVGEEKAQLNIRALDGGKPKPNKGKPATGRYKGDAPPSVEEGMRRCLVVADRLRAWFTEEHERPMEPMDKELAATLYINWERSGFSMHLGADEQAAADADEEDPAAIVEATTLKEIQDLIEKVEVQEDILEKMRGMIDAGMTQKTALRTLEYLVSLPKKDALPWEEEGAVDE